MASYWLRSLKHWFLTTQGSPSRRRRSCRPTIETLEDRCVPATTFVWNGASGVNTLWSNPDNWDHNAGASGAPQGNGEVIIFPATASSFTSTFDLPGGSQFASIHFQGSGYQVANAVSTHTLWAGDFVATNTSGTNTFAPGISRDLASLAIDVSDGGTLSLQGAISGQFTTLYKRQGGVLALSAASSYSGDTNLQGGTLRLDAANVLPGGTAMTIDSGATLLLSGNDETIGTLAGAGTVNLGSRPPFFQSGILTLGGSTDTTFSGNISGPTVFGSVRGTLTKTGSGAMTVSGTISTAALNVTAGTLLLDSNERLADSASVTVANGATLDLNGHTETIGSLDSAGTVDFGTLGTLSTGGNGASTTLAGTFDGSVGATLTKVGSGTMTLSATLTNNLSFFIFNASSGTVKVGTASALRNAVNLDGTLDLNGVNTTISELSGSGTITNGTSVPVTLTVGDPVNMTFSGTIQDGSGPVSLTKTGSATVTLSGASSYTGATHIQAGTLALAAANLLPGGTAMTIDSGATLDLQGFDETIGTLAGAGDVNLTRTVLFSTVSGTLTLAGSADTTYSGTISGHDLLGRHPEGALTKAGSGVLTLSGTVSTGAISVNGGTLQLGSNERLADSATVTVAFGATLDLNGHTETVGSLDSLGKVNFGSFGNLITGGNGASTTLGGTIDGSFGTLTKTGGGTMTLSASAANANSFSGLTVSGGTVRVGGPNVVPNAVTVDGTLDLAGASATIPLLSGGGTITSSVSVPVTLTVGTALFGSTFSGTIQDGSGILSLVKTGTNTLTLAGTNTWTGSSTISAGTLKIGTGSRLPGSTAVTVAGGAIFDLNNQNETIGSLAGDGAVALGTANLIVGGDNSSTTFNGTITGSGALTKEGTGTLTLGGPAANIYGGGTTLNAGALILAKDGAVGTGTVTLNAGTFRADDDNSRTLSNAITLAGDIAITNTSFLNSLTLTGPVTLGGAGTTRTITLGSAQVNFDGGLSGTARLVIQQSALAGVAAFDAASPNFSGGVSLASGYLTVNAAAALGTGTLVLDDGTQIQTSNPAGVTISNNVNISGGVGFGSNLDENNHDLHFQNGTVTLLGNSTFGVSNSTTIATPLSGGTFAFTKDGSGTLVLGGGTVGAITVSNGTLQPGTLNGNSLTLNSPATLAIDLNRTAPGGPDQVNVTGAATLGGGTLTVQSTGGFAFGRQFVLVKCNQPISEPFAGLPKGSAITAGGQHLVIRYTNDQVTLTVTPAISITPPTLSGGKVGIAYSRQLSASGGTAPYTFTLASGALPAGLTLSPAGLLQGTPTQAGTFTFTVRASDSSSGGGPFSATQTYTLTVQPGAVARVRFQSQPRGTAANHFLPAFAVQVLDRFGNRVKATVTLSLVVVHPGAHAHFGTGSVTRLTTVNGVATFRKVSISVKGTYRLVAHVGSVTVESALFRVA
jgi:autotransporter-associated beta strand protein